MSTSTPTPRNAVKCRYCGTIIESRYRHNFVSHTCPKMKEMHGEDAWIAVDGGNDYMRRIGNFEAMEELS